MYSFENNVGKGITLEIIYFKMKDKVFSSKRIQKKD